MTTPTLSHFAAEQAAQGFSRQRLEFVDLFAGLGGFHLALRRLGHTAVFACEIDPALRELYRKNFGLQPAGDIRTIPVKSIPSHDILCAGFPCQPFSKAGDQQGFACPRWGDLFTYVLRIIEHHLPQYVILENVPNLERHDGGATLQRMRSELTDIGYDVRSDRLSPHRFGIPQIRDRLYIVASRSSLDQFSWPEQSHEPPASISPILDRDPSDARRISPLVEQCLEVWQEFLDRFPKDVKLPSFPIWSAEFGATYPYERTTPHRLGRYRLRPYSGSHGIPLAGVRAAQRMNALPAYARTPERQFPDWKARFIRQNRDLYRDQKTWVDEWIPQLLAFPPSYQKLEWNCQGEERRIWSYVIQFRASGVRVKRPTTAPSLIAMTTSQVPIVAWERRYMTPRECARLQSMAELDHLPDTSRLAYGALGNAINVDIVEMIARALLADDRGAPLVSSTSRAREHWNRVTV